MAQIGRATRLDDGGKAILQPLRRHRRESLTLQPRFKIGDWRRRHRPFRRLLERWFRVEIAPGTEIDVEIYGEMRKAIVQKDEPLWDPKNERLRA